MYLCVWFYLLTTFYDEEPGRSSSSILKWKLQLKPRAFEALQCRALVARSHLLRAPSGYWAQLSHLCWWSWYSQFPQRNRGSTVTFPGQHQQWKAQVKLEREWCHLQFKQPGSASCRAKAASWAKPSQLHAPKKTNLLSACSTSPSQSFTPNQHFTATIRSDSAPCQTLTVQANVLLPQVFRAILLYAKTWHVELQMTTMRRLQLVQHNCSEYRITLKF